MAGAVIRYGRYVSAADTDIAEVGASSNQRACVYGYHSATYIAYRLESWAGRDFSTPSGRIFVGRTTGGGTAASRTPDTILAYTSPLTPTVQMTDQTGGGIIGGNITPVLLPGGWHALGWTASGGTVGVGERQAGLLDQSQLNAGTINANFYSKSISGTVPTNPIGGGAEYNGLLDIWAVCEANVAPNTPTALSPSGNITGGSLTPTFTSHFSDPNETLQNGVAFDQLTAVQVQVLQGSTILWDVTYTASGTEQANKVASRAYGGSTLSYGTSYTYKVRHQDIAGAWSAWASTTFTILAAGSVAQPASPSGLVLTQTPGPITAGYTHTTGLSTNAVQAQLLAANGAFLAASPSLAKTVAPGGTISITFAETGWSALAWATRSQVQVRARDTDNVWSPWSTAAIVDTDSAPNLPTSLAPAGGAAVTTLPVLTATVTDPDTAKGYSQTLTVTARVYDGSGTLLQTRTMTRVGTTTTYTYQTTATDLATYAAYQWAAQASDGTLSSAATAKQSFVYAQGPAVTLTAPGATVTTSTPLIDWDVTFSGGGTQASYRVQLLNPATGGVVYDTGTVASTTVSSHTVTAPGGANWIGGETWNNGETWTLLVTVTDTNALPGTATEAVTLSYTPPASLNATVAMLGFHDTHGACRALLAWDQSTDPGFQGYVVTQEALGPDLFGVTEPAITRETMTDQSETSLVVDELTPGTTYRWSVYQLATAGVDLLVGTVSVVTGQASFDGCLLHLPWAPDPYHCELRYAPIGDLYRPTVSLGVDNRTVMPLGGLGRVLYVQPAVTHDAHYDLAIVGDDLMQARDRIGQLESIVRAQQGNEDGRPHLVCLRDGRGTRLYGVLSNIQYTWEPYSIGEYGQGYSVSFDFTEIGFALEGTA